MDDHQSQAFRSGESASNSIEFRPVTQFLFNLFDRSLTSYQFFKVLPGPLNRLAACLQCCAWANRSVSGNLRAIFKFRVHGKQFHRIQLGVPNDSSDADGWLRFRKRANEGFVGFPTVDSHRRLHPIFSRSISNANVQRDKPTSLSVLYPNSIGTKFAIFRFPAEVSYLNRKVGVFHK